MEILDHMRGYSLTWPLHWPCGVGTSKSGGIQRFNKLVIHFSLHCSSTQQLHQLLLRQEIRPSTFCRRGAAFRDSTGPWNPFGILGMLGSMENWMFLDRHDNIHDVPGEKPQFGWDQLDHCPSFPEFFLHVKLHVSQYWMTMGVSSSSWGNP